LAVALTLAACGSDDDGGASGRDDDDPASSTAANTDPSAVDAGESADAGDGTGDARDLQAGGLDSSLCASLDVTSINDATGLEFGFVSGDQELAGEYGSVSCIFGLAEASTNYLYVDWQVRSIAFAKANYDKEVTDATDNGNGAATPFTEGDWDDAQVILSDDAPQNLQVLALAGTAVYSVRLSLADPIADQQATATATEPLLEDLDGRLFGG